MWQKSQYKMVLHLIFVSAQPTYNIYFRIHLNQTLLGSFHKFVVKFYIHGSISVLQSWCLAYWWVSNCFFHKLSYFKKSGTTFFVVIFYVICRTGGSNLSAGLHKTGIRGIQPQLNSMSTQHQLKLLSLVLLSSSLLLNFTI